MPAGMLPQLPPVPCRTERRHGAKQSEEESLMVTFFVCLVLLIVGFFTYSKLVEKTTYQDALEKLKTYGVM